MVNGKKPDKYKTIKIPLTKIIRDDRILKKINDTVIKTNKLVIHVYQFLRLWAIKKISENNFDFKIKKEFIKMAFKALIDENNKGPKAKGKNSTMLEDFNEFFKDVYSKLGYDQKMNIKNISGIIGYMCTDILTNIENNIRLNFFKYLRRYVNSTFNRRNERILSKITGTKRKEKEKLLKKGLNELKDDLINNTKLCSKNYHKWLDNNRSKLLPIDLTNSHEVNLSSHPQKYLKYMAFMINEIEKRNKLLEGKNSSIHKNNLFYMARQIKRAERILKYQNSLEEICNKDILKINLKLMCKKIKKIKESLNKKVERINFNQEKLFQFFPLRTSVVPKYCPFDTKILIDLFIKGKENLFSDIEGNKHRVWNKLFNLNHKVFRNKNYNFDYHISTDGLAVSIQFIHKSYIEEEKEKKRIIQRAIKETKQKTKNFTLEQKEAGIFFFKKNLTTFGNSANCF